MGVTLQQYMATQMVSAKSAAIHFLIWAGSGTDDDDSMTLTASGVTVAGLIGHAIDEGNHLLVNTGFLTVEPPVFSLLCRFMTGEKLIQAVLAYCEWIEQSVLTLPDENLELTVRIGYGQLPLHGVISRIHDDLMVSVGKATEALTGKRPRLTNAQIARIGTLCAPRPR